MKINIYNKVKNISNNIPINMYAYITKQKMILPFYHSVTNKPKAHIKHLDYYRTKNDFKNDITFFLNHYKSIPIKEIKKSNNMFFHLSFDDGLSEVYDEIIPLLKKEKIDASFFINTDFIDNKNMFYRHKISIIIDSIKDSIYNLNKVTNFLSCDKDTIYRRINKIRNDAEIEQIAQLLKIDFKEYLNDFKPYLTKSQLLEIKKMGFTIGNHSKNHPNFKNIPLLEQKKQVLEVNTYLQRELNSKDLYFSFPFGDENIKNDFFEFMYFSEKIIYSFGVSGLKKDEYHNHLHRIPMEYNNLSAKEIIKFEYFYFMLKSILNKNKIERKTATNNGYN
ncbi:MAG: polysaccharide deacetylase family protein [Polaribacter sp.]